MKHFDIDQNMKVSRLF